MRTMVTLACTECKRRNYTTKKNKQNNPERMELKKYCPWCRKHTLHKETRSVGNPPYRPVAPMVERRSPKPFVVGSSPTWPARLNTGLPLWKAGLHECTRPRPKG